jgi:hypothetical protein
VRFQNTLSYKLALSRIPKKVIHNVELEDPRDHPRLDISGGHKAIVEFWQHLGVVMHKERNKAAVSRPNVKEFQFPTVQKAIV